MIKEKEEFKNTLLNIADWIEGRLTCNSDCQDDKCKESRQIAATLRAILEIQEEDKIDKIENDANDEIMSKNKKKCPKLPPPMPAPNVR